MALYFFIKGLGKGFIWDPFTSLYTRDENLINIPRISAQFAGDY